MFKNEFKYVLELHFVLRLHIFLTLILQKIYILYFILFSLDISSRRRVYCFALL